MNEMPQSFIARSRAFWQRVTDGLEVGQLWNQFHSDARASYRLYQRDFKAQTPTQAKQGGFWDTTQRLTWAILEKLSPARRILLLVGLVLLLLPGGGFSYRGSDGGLEVVEFDAHLYGGLLLLALLILEIADRVVMKRDLEIARDIQGWLLPATPPEIPGIAIAFATRPANTVAGDYYDVFQRAASDGQPPKFLFAVADVAGKSIPAALLMATFQASLKTLSSTSTSLPDLVTGMNRYACGNSQNGLRFTTAFLAEYDPVTRCLTYINAGHNAPMLRRASGTIERLANGGLPLGIMADRTYESGDSKLSAGDWLIIFTDGLIEAENHVQEEFGELRLQQTLQAGANGTPQELLRRIMTDLDMFVGSTPQHDDVTCLLIKAG